MLRRRAVVSLLTEDVLGLTPEAREDDAPSLEPYVEAIDRALRRSRWIVLLDWGVLLTLFLTRDRTGVFLRFGGLEESVFTLGVLLIAAHSGFRLGQLLQQSNARRACLEVASR